MMLVAMLLVQAAPPEPAAMPDAAAAAMPDAAAAAMPAATGQTRACIEPREVRSTRLSAEHGYFVRLGRSDWWRNSAGGCTAYAPRRSISTFSNTERQCAGDVVQVFEAFTRIAYGACRLGRWEKLSAAPDLPDR